MIRAPLWLRRIFAKFSPRRSVIVTNGDSLPEELPRRDIVLARDDDDDWCVGFRCPCGCGERLELMLLKEVKPHWTLSTGQSGATLYPSVWRRTGCRSHFWLREGKVLWCD